MTPDRGGVRLARITVFSAAVLVLGATGHVLGGGGTPGPVPLVLGAIPCVLLAVWLTGRQVGTRRLVGALGALQALLHLVFHHVHGAAPVRLTATGHGAPHPVGSQPLATHVAGGITGPAGSAHHVTAAAGVAHHAGDLEAAAHGLTPQMILFHAAATLAAAWLMARGEAALWATLERLFPPLPGRLVTTSAPPRLSGAGLALPRPAVWQLRGSMTLRGPPALPA